MRFILKLGPNGGAVVEFSSDEASKKVWFKYTKLTKHTTERAITRSAVSDL